MRRPEHSLVHDEFPVVECAVKSKTIYGGCGDSEVKTLKEKKRRGSLRQTGRKRREIETNVVKGNRKKQKIRKENKKTEKPKTVSL